MIACRSRPRYSCCSVLHNLPALKTRQRCHTEMLRHFLPVHSKQYYVNGETLIKHILYPNISLKYFITPRISRVNEFNTNKIFNFYFIQITLTYNYKFCAHIIYIINCMHMSFVKEIGISFNYTYVHVSKKITLKIFYFKTQIQHKVISASPLNEFEQNRQLFLYSNK